jgi:hypothetical protein
MDELQTIEIKRPLISTKDGVEVDEEGNKKKFKKLELPECYEAKVSARMIGDDSATQIFSLMDREGKIVTRCDFTWDETKEDWVEGEMDNFLDFNEDLVTDYKCSRFSNKRWKSWWERGVAERYSEIAVLEDRKAFLQNREYVEIDFAQIYLNNRLDKKGSLYILKKYRTPLITIRHRFERLRHQELKMFEFLSMNWSFPKWASKTDEDTDKAISYYNHEKYFEIRKIKTKSPIPAKFRSFGSLFMLQSSMPYSVEGKDGKPLSGDKQTWVDKGYIKVSHNVVAKLKTREEYLKLLKEHEDKLLKEDCNNKEELDFVHQQLQ